MASKELALMSRWNDLTQQASVLLDTKPNKQYSEKWSEMNQAYSHLEGKRDSLLHKINATKEKVQSVKMDFSMINGEIRSIRQQVREVSKYYSNLEAMYGDLIKIRPVHGGQIQDMQKAYLVLERQYGDTLREIQGKIERYLRKQLEEQVEELNHVTPWDTSILTKNTDPEESLASTLDILRSENMQLARETDITSAVHRGRARLLSLEAELAETQMKLIQSKNEDVRKQDTLRRDDFSGIYKASRERENKRASTIIKEEEGGEYE